MTILKSPNLDDLDWDWDDDEQDKVAGTDEDDKNPSRTTLKSLQSVAKPLLESDSVSHRISPSYVKGVVFYTGVRLRDRKSVV